MPSAKWRRMPRRFDLAGFTQPEFALGANTECLRIETTTIRSPFVLRDFSVGGRCGQEPSGDSWRATGRPEALSH